jgi:hypothetical protein
MYNKMKDQVHAYEVKKRYWTQLNSNFPKATATQLRNLFKSDQKVYLFR